MAVGDLLTQEEIDSLLHGIEVDPVTKLAFDDFEEYLCGRNSAPEEPYGIFTKDVAVIKFYDDKHAENILHDIRQKNKKNGMGNITIPNTNIELINYSYCPKCNEIYSYEDLLGYYARPAVQRNISIATQYRKDTRVHCRTCGKFFLPALIICDGTPKQEVQFLCRVQVIDSIEEYFLETKIHVLTKKKTNVVNFGFKKAIKNDVMISALAKKPTLISNFIQYMPPDLMLSFIKGKNVEQDDLLFSN